MLAARAVVRRLGRRAMAAQSHYESHTASSYESAYFYSPGAYMDHLSRLVATRLGLQAETRRRILDIGGGTGNFTQLLLERAPESEAIVVDPFLPETATQLPASGSRLLFAKAPAEDLALPKGDTWWRQGYEQVLLKEVIHHVEERERFFRGVYSDLKETGNDPALLIITRPQLDVDYPLWDAARKAWALGQPCHLDIEADLRKAGFSEVSSSFEAYPCEIPMEKWLEMVRNRCWSTFARFSDEELDRACAGLRETENHRLGADGLLHFEDRLIFISARK